MAPPNTTNYAGIQEDEVEALRSIYMDDFQEEMPKIGAWNVCNNILLGTSEVHTICHPFKFLFHHTPDLELLASS